MYELIQISKDVFFMDCPAKVGFFKTGNDEVILIDSGSDKDSGKKVKKILDDAGWKLNAIYNTHSHADHIGGNQYLQNQTDCKIYARGIESAITEYPILEPTMLYGGFAMKELQSKFLMAKESNVNKLTKENLPEGVEIINLPGHSYDMVGFKTDNVIFLADCLLSAEVLEKYQFGFIYDVRSYISTLEMIKTLEADCFIPSHAPHIKDIRPLVQLNIDKTYEIIEKIKNIISVPMTFEEILSKVFSIYNLMMTLQQRMLIGSTLKSYLSYLKDEGQIGFYFENNLMLWFKI